MKCSHIVLATVAVLAFGFSGCGGPGGRAPIAQTTGVVTLDGEPIEGARVSFMPVEEEIAGLFSHAMTDKDGKFTMSTYGLNDGALVGRHKVIVTKPEKEVKFDPNELSATGYGGTSQYQEMMAGGARGRGREMGSDLPKKYADKETSGIEILVEQGVKNDVPINLTR